MGICGYHPFQITIGMCKHNNVPLNFNLVVDKFGIEYITKSDLLTLAKC